MVTFSSAQTPLGVLRSMKVMSIELNFAVLKFKHTIKKMTKIEDITKITGLTIKMISYVSYLRLLYFPNVQERFPGK